MIPAFPRGHQTVGRGSVKLGPRSLHFRSASALLFRRVGSIPRRLQGGCTGLCELSCLFWLLRCFKTTSLVLKKINILRLKDSRITAESCLSYFCVCVLLMLLIVCVRCYFMMKCFLPNKMPVWVVFEKEFLDGVSTSVSAKSLSISLLRRWDNFQPCLWWENQVF